MSKLRKTEHGEVAVKPFPSVWTLSDDYGSGVYPKTLIELQMMQLSQTIREKNDWRTKFFNDEIRLKWRNEANQQGISDEMITYVFDELEHYYHKSLENGIEIAAIDGVYQGDRIIPDNLKQDLINGVAVLENVSEELKDWHPGSNKQVLDLVHPSLFCYVIGRSPLVNTITEQNYGTKLLWRDFIGKSVDNKSDTAPTKKVTAFTYFCQEKINQVKKANPVMQDAEITKLLGKMWSDLSNAKKKPYKMKAEVDKERSRKRDHSAYSESTMYQWLPSNFKIDNSGNVTIKSYINNLHPHTHTKLYATIASIFEKFVPLFNKTLSYMLNPLQNRIQGSIDYEDEPANLNEDEDAWETYYNNREPQPISIPKYTSRMQSSDRFTINGRTVQVIVKLADIILTPDNPKYNGGVWHVEGMKNEHIVATGIYYYHTENITDSELKFRQAVCEPDYEQNDDNGVRIVYGLVNEGPLNQILGGLKTIEDRCIVFPNTLQHRVSPFELMDKTKPGYRKILVFFLVDPTQTIISTSVVPPQQHEWWRMEVHKVLQRHNFLLQDVIDVICDFAGTPMTLEEAKKHRTELMKERKYFVSKENEVFERPFSLCEH